LRRAIDERYPGLSFQMPAYQRPANNARVIIIYVIRIEAEL